MQQYAISEDPGMLAYGNRYVQLWEDWQKILELIDVFGEVKYEYERTHKEVENRETVYGMLVEAKQKTPSVSFNRYDLREFVRFSPEQGFVAGDVLGLMRLGYLKEEGDYFTGFVVRLTDFARKELKRFKPSEDREAFKSLYYERVMDIAYRKALKR